MCREMIINLIFLIASEFGVPEYFALSIAIEESNLNPYAINTNRNGTIDYGLFQLNSVWYNDEQWYEPERNIRAGIEYLKYLMDMPDVHTWYAVALVYNAGLGRLNNPPMSTINYAVNVMERYNELTNERIEIVIRKKK